MSKANKRRLSKQLKSEFIVFLETHTANNISRNLRRTLMDYLYLRCETGLPVYMKELLYALNDLFDLLDTAGKEFKN